MGSQGRSFGRVFTLPPVEANAGQSILWGLVRPQMTRVDGSQEVSLAVVVAERYNLPGPELPFDSKCDARRVRPFLYTISLC